jgi:hypothetical protein
MSSRLATDDRGRLIVVGTCLELRGMRWLVVDLLELGFTPPGRPPSPEEMLRTRTPYDSNSAKRTRLDREEIPDELLADEEAVRLAYTEQRRTPPDLVNLAA